MSTLIGFRQLIKFTAKHRRFSAGVRMRLMKSLDEDTGLEIRYESAIKKLLDISGPETIFWTTSYSRHPIYTSILSHGGPKVITNNIYRQALPK